MDRTYVICHMVTSMDGKILGPFLNEEAFEPYMEDYEVIHDGHDCGAWMVGRVSMEEHYTEGYQADLSQQAITVTGREDFVAPHDGPSYAIAIDSSGKLNWRENHISYESSTGFQKQHIIEVLAEKVSDVYLSYLREMGISYIFGGQDALDFQLILQKLRHLFGIQRVLLEGGGMINGAFFKQGLIDEVSLLLAPVIDGSFQARTMVEAQDNWPVYFQLEKMEQRPEGGVWLQYKRKV